MNAKPSEEAQQSLSKWQERIQALHNIPPLFRMVWESAPKPVGANVTCRILAGLVPLAMLRVTQAIIAALYSLQSHGTANLVWRAWRQSWPASSTFVTA
jgi:ATP-binding cassette, subfamily B, bacterial